MTTVVDASVILALVDNTVIDDLLRKRLTRVVMHAPALIDAEVLNAVRGLVIGGKKRSLKP
jgi:predicted nucleic acid-binding protein